MSVLVSDLIDRALVAIGDPAGDRIKRLNMLQFYNQIQLKLATEYNTLEKDEYFDIVSGEPRYTYPDNAVQMSGLRLWRINPPASINDYYWVDEQFREGFREATNWFRSEGMVTTYIARPGWFELTSTPSEDVVRGGIFTGWFRPAWLTSEIGQYMELRDTLEGTVQEGMEIKARIAGRERDAARQDYQLWVESLANLRPKMEDLSDDRRASLRTRGQMFPTRGQR